MRDAGVAVATTAVGTDIDPVPPSELTTADLLTDAPSRRGLISGAGALGVLAGAAVLAGADALVPEAAEAAGTDPVAHLLRRTTYGMNTAQIPQCATRARQVARRPDEPVHQGARHGDGSPRQPLAPAEAGTSGRFVSTSTTAPGTSCTTWSTLHIARAMWSRRQLLEIMVDFWSNHFNITCPSATSGTPAPFDRDVIRKQRVRPLRGHARRVGEAPGDAQLPQQRRQHEARRRTRTTAVSCSSCTPSASARGYTETDMHNWAMILTGLSIGRARAVAASCTRLESPHRPREGAGVRGRQRHTPDGGEASRSPTSSTSRTTRRPRCTSAAS